ncbi:hypothetical protein ACO2Q3_03310 [Caulobacter sp. KR2-114]|uniref:hypothetical protein n=1 Tax=Caulobacter sp. KR2-114 TaxID=3400912 RepID=UPI003C0288AD
MLKAIFRRQIDAFERDFNYDAGYMRDLLDASSWKFLRFSVVPALGRGKSAPAEAVAAAGIVGTLAEDCGPCTQIGVDIAARGGIKPQILRAILAGDLAAMGETAALGYRFAKAVLARDLEEADPLRDQILTRWGKAGLVDISLALTTARMYPTLKYGLGHGKACSRVLVAGETAPFHKPLAEPVAA